MEKGSESRCCINCNEKIEIREIAKAEHLYKQPKFVWADNNEACTAVFGCQTCKEEKSVKCEVDKYMSVPVWCTTEGEMTYAARYVFAGQSYIEFRTTKISASGHEMVYINDRRIRHNGTPVSVEVHMQGSSGSIKLYWNKVEGADGYNIYRYENSNGKWSEIPEKIGEVKGRTKTSYLDKNVVKGERYLYKVFSYAEEKGSIFIDVNDKDWYFRAVDYVFYRGIMSGYGSGEFGPADNLGRGQFATILYRMEGRPDIEYQYIFPDVQDGQFYSIPAVWANKAGIITGYGNGNFGAGDSMTREQLATMMYRYAKYKGYDVSMRADLTSFPDYESVGGFSQEAMKWAVAVGLISGDQGKLNPQGNSSRAVTAVIIQRFMEAY